MKNRGPNNQQALAFEEENLKFLLHSRLSIIDLASNSNQPFTLMIKLLFLMEKFIIILRFEKNLEKEGMILKQIPTLKFYLLHSMSMVIMFMNI